MNKQHVFYFIVALTGFMLSLTARAQTIYVINDGESITECDGKLFDTGNATGNYSDNENITYTICASLGAPLLEFSGLDIDGSDVLNIYNGSSATGTPEIAINSANVLSPDYTFEADSTCVTLEFISDGATNGAGWDCNISCYTPCQTVIPEIVSASPDFNTGTLDINLCQGDSLHLEAGAQFPENNTFYTQSHTLTTYEWDFNGDGISDYTGSSFDSVFTAQNGTSIILNAIDSNNCSNSNLFRMFVRVSTNPTWHGLEAEDDPICYLESNVLSLDSVKTVGWYESYGNVLADTTALPDGSGLTYSTGVTLSNFSNGQTLDDINDLFGICMDIEHSYLGDLEIAIECPSGQTVILLDYPNTTSGTFLGEPVDGNLNVTGTGYEYCFSPAPTYGTFNDEAGSYQQTFTDNDGQTQTNADYLPSGSYASENPLDGLVGCELNGDWTIHITDNQSIDDGTIFSWYIDFDPSIFPNQLWGYEPTITSMGWDPDPSITSTNGNEITVTPTVSDSNVVYTYSIIDDFGCAYDTSISFYVIPPTDPNCRVCFPPEVETIDALCFDDTSGTIFASHFDTLGVSPPPYEFYWIDVQTTSIVQTSTGKDADTLLNLGAGSYYVVVVDSNQCRDSSQVVIGEPTEITSFEVGTFPAKCFGECTGTGIVESQGGTSPYTYSWPNNETGSTNSALCGGLNTVTVTDFNGCKDTLSVSISQTPAITVTTKGHDTLCYSANGFMTIEASGGNGGYSVLWNIGSNNDTIFVSPETTSAYSAVVVDQEGCTGTVTDTIYVRPPLTLELDEQDTICNGDSLILRAIVTGGDNNYSFQWSGGLGNTDTLGVAPISDFTYFITVSDGCGTPAKVTKTDITVGQYPTFVLYPPSSNGGCAPQFVEFSVDTIQPLRKYTWDFGEDLPLTQNLTSVGHLYTEPGCFDFNLHVENIYGCARDTTLICAVEIFPNPEADFYLTEYDLNNITSTTTFIDNSYLSDFWQWNFDDGTSSDLKNVQHTFKDTGVYNIQLAVETIHQCKDTTELEITLEYETAIYMPNSFTPNGDGNNDFFMPSGSGIDINNYKLLLYNRWGNLIFSTTDLNEGWDGSINGKGAQEAIYVYRVEYIEHGDTEPTKLTGHFSLLKTP